MDFKFYKVNPEKSINEWYEKYINGYFATVKTNVVFDQPDYTQLPLSDNTLKYPCDILIAGFSYVGTFNKLTKKYDSGEIIIDTRENDNDTPIECTVKLYGKRYNNFLYIGEYTTTNGEITIDQLNNDCEYQIVVQDVNKKYTAKQAILTPKYTENSRGIEKRYELTKDNKIYTLFSVYGEKDNSQLILDGKEKAKSVNLTKVSDNVYQLVTEINDNKESFDYNVVWKNDTITKTYTIRYDQEPNIPVNIKVYPTSYSDILAKFGEINKDSYYVTYITPYQQNNEDHLKTSTGKTIYPCIQVTLSVDITKKDTIIKVQSFPNYNKMYVGCFGYLENEIVKFVSYDKTTQLMVIERGINNTIATSHNANQVISFYNSDNIFKYDIDTFTEKFKMVTDIGVESGYSDDQKYTATQDFLNPQPILNIKLNGDDSLICDTTPYILTWENPSYNKDMPLSITCIGTDGTGNINSKQEFTLVNQTTLTIYPDTTSFTYTFSFQYKDDNGLQSPQYIMTINTHYTQPSSISSQYVNDNYQRPINVSSFYNYIQYQHPINLKTTYQPDNIQVPINLKGIYNP